jgi:DNA (cytosine-5)-methyltransferase 1
METILAIRGSVNHTIPLLRFPNLESLFRKMEAWFSETLNFGHTPYKARRLSVAEALALQSLPKDFYLPDTMTLTSMFKTVGNGVP